MSMSMTRSSLLPSIFMTHVRRLGWVRTFLGGGLMYLSVFEFVVIHLSFVVLLYHGILRPVFSLPAVDRGNYLHYRRHLLDRLNWLDQLNCYFCSYANGTTKLWNDELDIVATAQFKGVGYVRLSLALLYILLVATFLIFNIFFSSVLFFVIAFFLEYRRSSITETLADLDARGFADSCPKPFRFILRLAKTYALILSVNLAQIESSWCPLRYMERENQKTPDHHKDFFCADQAEQLYDVLSKRGTVYSPNERSSSIRPSGSTQT